MIKHAISNLQFDTASEVQGYLQQNGINLSIYTINRTSKEMDMEYKSTNYEPILTDQHKEDGLKFSKETINCADWTKVIFTDVTKICLNQYPKMAWRPKGEKKIKPKVKHSIGLSVWGCMCSNGLGKQLFITRENIKGNTMVDIYPQYLLSESNKWLIIIIEIGGF